MFEDMSSVCIYSSINFVFSRFSNSSLPMGGTKVVGPSDENPSYYSIQHGSPVVTCKIMNTPYCHTPCVHQLCRSGCCRPLCRFSAYRTFKSFMISDHHATDRMDTLNMARRSHLGSVCLCNVFPTDQFVYTMTSAHGSIC